MPLPPRSILLPSVRPELTWTHTSPMLKTSLCPHLWCMLDTHSDSMDARSAQLTPRLLVPMALLPTPTALLLPSTLMWLLLPQPISRQRLLMDLGSHWKELLMSTPLLFLLILMESMAARSVRLILRSSLLELTELILMLVTGMPVFLMVFRSPLWLDTPTVPLSHWNPQRL